MIGDEEQQGTGSCDADGRLAGEAWSAGPLAGLHLAQAYNGQGKRQMLTLGSRDREWGRSDFGYDAQGRLATVASGTVSARYEYSAAKTRLPDVHVQNAQGREVLRTTRAYDALDRLVRIENASLAPDGAATILSSHEYVTNDAGQRLKSTLADGSYWVYSYDRLGQVTGGVKYSAAGQELPGHRFDYRFDDIGNRRSATIPGTAGLQPGQNATQPGRNATQPGTAGLQPGQNATYRYNLLNQYTQIQLGPQVSPLTYDADGNLLTDGRWRYTWDAENRLLAVESIPNVGARTTPRLRLLFAYDHQSRRLQRREFTWNETTQNWTAATDTRYLYDNWNCVAEFAGSGALQTRYVWGLDLSGSEQGAGGVGGLLFGIWSSPSFQGPVSSFYCYDGNGNVVALASTVDGALQARYDYAPFGETVSAEDVAASNRGTEAAPTLGLAAQNPYRFSTKPQDPATHLYYYGYRWYSADFGRWLSRDPIGEMADKSPYVLSGANPINGIDVLGLATLIMADILSKKPDLMPDNSTKLGYTNWSFTITVSKVRCPTGGKKLKAHADITPMIHIRENPPEWQRGRFGHEQRHVQNLGILVNILAANTTAYEEQLGCIAECDIESKAKSLEAKVKQRLNTIYCFESENHSVFVHPKEALAYQLLSGTTPPLPPASADYIHDGTGAAGVFLKSNAEMTAKGGVLWSIGYAPYPDGPPY